MPTPQAHHRNEHLVALETKLDCVPNACKIGFKYRRRVFLPSAPISAVGIRQRQLETVGSINLPMYSTSRYPSALCGFVPSPVIPCLVAWSQVRPRPGRLSASSPGTRFAAAGVFGWRAAPSATRIWFARATSFSRLTAPSRLLASRSALMRAVRPPIGGLRHQRPRQMRLRYGSA